VNDEVRQRVLSIANELRARGIPSDVDVKRRSLAKQLEYADSLGIPYVLIIGPEELQTSRFKFRDMGKRVEENLTLDEVIGRVAAKSVQRQ